MDTQKKSYVVKIVDGLYFWGEYNCESEGKQILSEIKDDRFIAVFRNLEDCKSFCIDFNFSHFANMN